MDEELIESVREDCVAACDPAGLEALRDRRVLITGGTGFVGTWLTEMIAYLNDEFGLGIRVALLAPHASDFGRRVPHLATRTDVELMERDVRDISALPDDVTHVIHAAGTPDNRVHASDPMRTMSVVTAGTAAVMRAAVGASALEKIVMVSSGLVYGPQPLELEGIPERWVGGPECDSIASVYAEAKRYAEVECAAWRGQTKLPIVTARPFAFIGPYQGLDKPWAVNNFVRDALLGGPIRILGCADTVRSYMYPSDMAFWLLRILVDGVSGTSYNVGSPEAVTLQHLAEVIAHDFREPSAVVCRGANTRPSRFVPDVTRARETLGLRVTVGLEDAIARTLAWHRLSGASDR